MTTVESRRPTRRVPPVWPVLALVPALFAGGGCDDGGSSSEDDAATGDDGARDADADHGADADADADADGVWRPFNDDSPWNTRIPADPALEPDSAALIADFMASSPFGPYISVNLTGYSIPLYWADASTPTYSVLADYGGEGWVGTDGANAWATMPIPDGATPDPESDHHISVVDRGRGLEWGCWNMRNESGQWHAGVCATADLSGTGVRTPATLAEHWYDAIGSRACGFPLVAGLIRVEEVAAGRIEHALVVAYPHIRSGWFTPPASTGQGRVGDDAISTRGIPCGGRIQLDPAVDIDALGVSDAWRTILRALQEYGAYVGDFSGALSLYAENSAAAQAAWTGVLDPYGLGELLDYSRLRVLRLGTLYDYGNGD